MKAEEIFDEFVKGDRIEKELVLGLMQLYAKGKCREQREICANTGKHQKFGLYQYKKPQMIEADEPLLD